MKVKRSSLAFVLGAVSARTPPSVAARAADLVLASVRVKNRSELS
jgi:hypothetical protein